MHVLEAIMENMSMSNYNCSLVVSKYNQTVCFQKITYKYLLT